MKPALARDRLRQVLERWFLTEPLLFSLWSDHQVTVEPVATIRVGGGIIGYNPDFIESLTPAELEAVMRGEAVRILLKHPYSRRLLPPRIAWQASNLTLREHLGALPLPLPTAFERRWMMLAKRTRFSPAGPIVIIWWAELWRSLRTRSV